MCLGGEIGRRTGLKILWMYIRTSSSLVRGTTSLSRSRAVRQLVGLITRRSLVQIQSPQPIIYSAGIAQMVERQPSKLNVASSTLVSRSI